jgi:predicted RecB family nuclease
VKDPREELTLRLLESLGREGSICVYSDYERSVIGRLAEALPSLRQELQQLLSRLWDLFDVVKDHYYHPAFKGSYSIKSVLPAVVPALGYGDLEIRDGEIAARAYHRMLFDEADWVEKARLREALLKYCARDTLAMVELRKALRGKGEGL